LNIRPSEPADFERLVELFKRGFGMQPDALFLRMDIMQWKYWEARSDWSEPRSYVVERDGRLLAHVGVWPSVLHLEGRDQRGMQIYDWVADPSTTGAGRRLLRHMNSIFDFVYSVGGQKRAVAMLPLLGFSLIAQSWKAALPLKPWKMLRHPAYYGPRLPGRLMRNLAWSVPRRCNPDWSFEAAEPGELPEAPLRMTGFQRNAEFFRYLARCPGRSCFTYRVLNRDMPAGFFVLMQVRHHVRAAVWLDDPTPEACRAIYALAAQAARTHSELLELVVTGTSQTSADAANLAGFHIRSTAPIYVLKRGEPWQGSAADIEFQITDVDGIFFDDGEALALC
jgi:hypothetical protein